jgi:hypothetical protein
LANLFVLNRLISSVFSSPAVACLSVGSKELVDTQNDFNKFAGTTSFMELLGKTEDSVCLTSVSPFALCFRRWGRRRPAGDARVALASACFIHSRLGPASSGQTGAGGGKGANQLSDMH